MKAVYLRIRSDRGPDRTASCSKRLIQALVERQFLSTAEVWRVEDHEARRCDPRPASSYGIPVHSFPTDPQRLHDHVTSHVQRVGGPDILWIEGTGHPAHLAALFQMFPRSFKIVYSKHWEPWIVEHLDRYDLCLIDDPAQESQVHLRWPTVRCGVWDKLVDYTQTHRPIACEKTYDVCYVAYLRPRKNHDLLFRSLAALHDRRLRCVCIGEDRRANAAVLERLATELRIDVKFTGGLGATGVNALVNRSRIGVMCSRRDAAPRAILEYMAADVPVLVNSELLAGARYVGPQAGLVRSPDQFASGIAEMLDNVQRFAPRAHYLANYSTDQVVDRFVGMARAAGLDLRRATASPLRTTQGGTSMTHPKQPAPLVIGCMGGSGSRMLRDILAASPQIHMDRNCGPSSKDSLGSKVFLDRDDRGSPEYRSLIHRFMRDVVSQIPPAAQAQCLWFGWKNPRNIQIVDLLLEMHPRLRFLHLIRNPAALVNGSQGRKKFKRERDRGNPEAQGDRRTFVLNRWVRINLPVWRRHREDPRYRLVYYEEFVRNPRASIASLYEWLGVAAPDWDAVLPAVAPPADALTRGRDIDISLIADAAAELGYAAGLATANEPS